MSAAFAALTAIFGKLGVQGVSSNLATFIRTAIILVFIALVVSFRSEWQKPEKLEANAVLFLVLSAITTGVSWLCYYRALQLGPASRVAPIDKLSLALVVILSIVFLGESVNWPVVIGAVLITTGAIIIGVAG
jgi:transporter family protein